MVLTQVGARRVWIIGRLSGWLLRLHIRHEIKPYAVRRGYSTDEVRAVCHARLDKIFDRAWQ